MFCHHGKCQSYVNTQERHWCQCDNGWTSDDCTQSTVASAPLCVLGRTGPDCQIEYDTCKNVYCQNNGTCVSIDMQTLQYACICEKKFFGNLCQYQNAQLILRTTNEISFISILIIHMLHTLNTNPGLLSHRNIYFFRNIHPNTKLIIYDEQQEFLAPIILIEMYVTGTFDPFYYLLSFIVNNRTITTTMMLRSSCRCANIRELMNSTINNYSLLKQKKFYHHLPLQGLKCFYDSVYICLVDRYQMIDCLNFNYHAMDCTERNYCLNNGRCLQGRQTGQFIFA
ncbi:unnamed protein product [Rotaria sp. Silwood2]|nr:unnamed protein product [Rotaria sp. Silwood2]CAF3094649.1 unnamed protein product [Rotaria sp. Silwood2]CAF3423428.1 unnamed protein product [Rotaria sp. Silwood2]CAF3545488.1 unnamed protein product [Rotaria sp. Silwood2]CAF4297056.1 unnamed protein product [Rotaria sp. Silwood2]